MRISINKEIEEEYKDQFMRGFSMKECAYIAVALLLIAGAAFLAAYFFKLSFNVCVYIGLPFGIPVLIFGFKKFQGLTLTEYIKEIIYEHKTKELFYDADEIPESFHCYEMKKHEPKKAGKKR